MPQPYADTAAEAAMPPGPYWTDHPAYVAAWLEADAVFTAATALYRTTYAATPADYDGAQSDAAFEAVWNACGDDMADAVYRAEVALAVEEERIERKAA